MHPDAPYFSILFCLTPDDFTREMESAATQWDNCICNQLTRHRFSGEGCVRTALKSFYTPANYIYFDLIVSYLIILTTKFVKLPILWSQISPCRPRKQILLNFFLGLSGHCHHAPAKASSSTPPDIYPHTPERKYENLSLQLTYLSL